jgi:hypothetical protein
MEKLFMMVFKLLKAQKEDWIQREIIILEQKISPKLSFATKRNSVSLYLAFAKKHPTLVDSDVSIAEKYFTEKKRHREDAEEKSQKRARIEFERQRKNDSSTCPSCDEKSLEISMFNKPTGNGGGKCRTAYRDYCPMCQYLKIR